MDATIGMSDYLMTGVEKFVMKVTIIRKKSHKRKLLVEIATSSFSLRLNLERLCDIVTQLLIHGVVTGFLASFRLVHFLKGRCYTGVASCK